MTPTQHAAVVPNVTDLDQAGFWAAANDRQLAIQVCAPAGHVLHLPRGYCHRCDTFDVRWEVVDGAASVHTWTIVEHTVDADFPAPYAVVLVELDAAPGVRFVTDLPGRPELHIGQPMHLTFERVRDDVTIPRWVPVPSTDGLGRVPE